MGVSYAAIDRYMDGGAVTDAERAIIERFHRNSEHKRVGRMVTAPTEYMPIRQRALTGSVSACRLRKPS